MATKAIFRKKISSISMNSVKLQKNLQSDKSFDDKTYYLESVGGSLPTIIVVNPESNPT